MRRIGNHLHRLFELHIAAFVKHQRQQYRYRESRDQRVYAQRKRICDKAVEAVRTPEVLEVLHAYPLAAPYALTHLKILKRDLNAVHRAI